MNEVAVTAHNLSVSFGSGHILDRIDLTVAAGEFVAVIGRSGEGKTTLLNSIAGLTPYSGHVETARRLSFVFQNNALFPWMTVQDNILFGIADKPKKEQLKVLERLATRLGIADLLSRYPYQISGGQAQRAAIGRALAVDPEIILMDEPFAALDYYTRNEMEDWFSKVCAEEGRAILFVSHNVEEALFLADRVVVLKHGKTKDFFVGFPRPRSSDIRYTSDFIALRKELLDLMRSK